MQRLRCTLFLLFLTLCCSAQNASDSLRSAYRNHLHKNQFDHAAYCLSQIAYAYDFNKEYDSSLYYSYQILRLQNRIANPALIAWANNAIGAAYNFKGHPDSSIFYYNRAVTLFQAANDTVNLSTTGVNLAVLYKDIGLYPEAIELCIQLLPVLENQINIRPLASAYNTIGLCYLESGEIQRALLYQRKALLVRQTLGNPRLIAISYNNIGEAYKVSKSYDSALFYLNKSLSLKRAEVNKNSWPVTLNNIGSIFLLKKEYKSAERYFHESLDINNENNDRLGEVEALNYLCRTSLAQEDYIAAEKHLGRSEILAHSAGALNFLKETLELRAQLHREKGEYKKALAYTEEANTIKDSIFGIDKIEAMLKTETRFQTEKKEREILFLQEKEKISQAEIDSKNFSIQLFILALALIAVIIGLGAYNFLIVRKGKAKVETLLKELHHRVKNNLQILSSLLTIQSQELTDEKAKQAVKTSEGRVNAMALIHKKLYSVDVNQEINIQEYITELVEYLAQTYGFMQQGIKLNFDVQTLKIDVDKAIPLGLIINEIVSNAFKHAYIDHESPELTVTLKLEANKELALMIRDNGRASSIAAIKESKSYGLKMVRTLTKDLRGKMNITNGAGTAFELKFLLNNHN